MTNEKEMVVVRVGKGLPPDPTWKSGWPAKFHRPRCGIISMADKLNTLNEIETRSLPREEAVARGWKCCNRCKA